MRKVLLKSILVLIFMSLSPFIVAHFSQAFAAEYYIAGDTGVDTNPGTSGQPWKTLTKANTTLIAGDTVYVKGGLNYDKRINPSNSGTAVARITYKAWPGTGIPILKNVTDGYPARVVSKGYITINGFQLDAVNSAKVMDLANTTDLRVSNCILIGGELTFAGVYAILGTITLNNNVITCLGCQNGASSMEGIHTNSTVSLEIRNNIFYNLPQDFDLPDAAAVSINGSTAVTNTNNLFYNNDINYYGTGPGTNEISADPLFVDPSNGDFNIRSNSPVINAGADVSANGVTTDILGRARPNAGAYDIGAYEDPNIYVAGDVSSSGNGSMQSPYKTIQEAADVTTPGDVVNVKGGLTYTGANACFEGTAVLCVSIAGTSTQLITFKTWPGTGIPIIDARDSMKGVAISKEYIRLTGFTIIEAGQNVSGIRRAGIHVATFTGTIILTNNILVHGQDDGIYYLGLGTNSIISNNTILNGESDGLYLHIMSGGGSMNVRNNISINNQDSNFTIVSGSSLPNYGNNLMFGGSNNYAGIAVAQPSDIINDPLFINLADSNYRLQPNSPAINAGIDTSVYGVTTDILGVPRPQGPAYDIGAFEYYSVPVSITSPTTTYVTTTSPTVAGAATTTATGAITNVEYSLDNGAWTTANGNFSFTLNDLSQGSHTVRVRATDNYGNQTHESEYAAKTFIVDSITPTILLTKLGKITDLPDKAALTYYFTSQTPKIEGVTEANSTVTFMVGAETYSTQADSNGHFVITLDEPKLVRGESLITYKSTDTAGNTSETRTLELIIGEEYFPAWIYEKVVIEGQDIDEVDQDGDPDEEPAIPAEVYKILFKDEDENPITDTKVEIDGRFYTTDIDGFIYITDIEKGEIPYKINDTSGTLQFDPDKEVNVVVVEISADNENPDINKTDKDKSDFNWWWVIIVITLITSGWVGYTYILKRRD